MQIGDGLHTSLWFDSWMPRGPICHSPTDRVIYDSGLSKDAKVSDIISFGHWSWPVANSTELLDLKEETLSLPLPICFRSDMVMWNGTKEFSIKAAWEVLYTHSPKVPWKHLVWFKYYIPRHSFILWLAIRKRLSTQDRLLSFGTIQSMLCHLCGDNDESHDHLFFGCPFSLRVWTAILAKCGINVSSSTSSWSATQIWACSTFKGSTLLSCIGRLSLAAAVYSLWRERNSRLHGETPKTEPMLITLIVDLVRMRLFDCSGFPNTPTNLHLVHSWHLPLSLIGG